MTVTTKTEGATPGRLLKLPIGVWILMAVGALAGVLLAEPGNFWGNTVPSALTFLVLGLIIGLIGWGIVAVVRRGTDRS